MSPTFRKKLLTFSKEGARRRMSMNMEKRFSRRFLVEKRTNCSFESFTKADTVTPRFAIPFVISGLFSNHVCVEEPTFLATRWAPSPIIIGVKQPLYKWPKING